MQDAEQIPESIRKVFEPMSTRAIGMWVHGLFPDDDPGLNRARCDAILTGLGRQLPKDWWALMTHGELSDRDFPAWFPGGVGLDLSKVCLKAVGV